MPTADPARVRMIVFDVDGVFTDGRIYLDADGRESKAFHTRDGFGVLRDPIACKPAVMAETDAYVAFGSEYRALAPLPGVDAARVWEPEPATVYFWRH